MADRFGGLAHALAVEKELSLARVVFVQPTKDIADRGGAVAGLAHSQVEQDAEQVTFVVVGDAASRQAIVLVLLEPSIEAGFFRWLSKGGWPPLQFADLVSQTLQIARFIEQASTQQDNIS